jgi:hypothetical protein
MATTPPFARGSYDISAITIASCTAASDGTLSYGSTKNIYGVETSLEYNNANETENISAGTSNQANNLKIEQNSSMTFEGLQVRNDSVSVPKNFVRDITYNYDLAQVIATIAGVAWTFVGTVKSFVLKSDGKGKIAFTLMMEQIDIGGANPAQA